MGNCKSGSTAMKTELTEFDGIKLVIPSEGFEWPCSTFVNFPPCCGPGNGFGNLIVPETILGMPVSPACYVHDWMFRNLEKTWINFHAATSIFHTNLTQINEAYSNVFMFHLRRLVILKWYLWTKSKIAFKIFIKA